VTIAIIAGSFPGVEEDFSAPHVRAKFIMILGPIRFKFEGRLCYFDRTMPTHLMHTHTAEAIQVSLFSQVLYLPCPRRQDVLRHAASKRRELEKETAETKGGPASRCCY